MWFALRLVNQAANPHEMRPRVDKPTPLVLNVHRERSRNGLASRFCLVSLDRFLSQFLLQMEAVSQSSALMSEPAEPAHSSSMSTAPSSLRARRSTPISPARNPAGRSKTRATGGAPQRSPFAKRSKLRASPPSPSPPSDFPAKCTAPSSSTKTTKSFVPR